MEASEDERRAAERVEAIVVVELDANGRHGVTRNVSGSGLLIAPRARFSPGDRIELTIHATSGPPLRTAGRVVRVDETPPEESWRYRIAVTLDNPVPEAIVREGAQAAASLLGKSPSVPPGP